VLIVGVGVNVDFDPAELGADLRHPATTLRTATGEAISVDAVVDAVARRLVDALTEFDELGLSEPALEELRNHLAFVGSVRSVQWAGRRMVGRVAGIDVAGRLLLTCGDGEVAVESGELLTDV
jgi:biotin-(acetyl-CoA carboxylase) ligase